MKTTLRKIWEKGPCGKNSDHHGWGLLTKNLGTNDLDTEVTLKQILKSNGIKDAVWALCVLDYDDRCLFLADAVNAAAAYAATADAADAVNAAAAYAATADAANAANADAANAANADAANAANADAANAANADAANAANADAVNAAAAYAATAEAAKKKKWEEIENLFIKYFC